MTFKNRLKELMIAQNLNQVKLSKDIDFSQRAISMWLLGQSEPKESALRQLADYFGCTVDYLIGREDEFGNVSIAANLTDDEKKLLFLFNSLPEARQQTLLDMVSDMYEANKSKVSSIKNKSIS